MCRQAYTFSDEGNEQENPKKDEDSDHTGDAEHAGNRTDRDIVDRDHDESADHLADETAATGGRKREAKEVPNEKRVIVNGNVACGVWQTEGAPAGWSVVSGMCRRTNQKAGKESVATSIAGRVTPVRPQRMASTR